MGEIRESAEQRTVIKTQQSSGLNWHHGQAPLWFSPPAQALLKACYLWEDAGIPLQAGGSPQKGRDHCCHVLSAAGAGSGCSGTKAHGLGMPPAPLGSPGRLVPTKAFGGSCKSRAPGTWANLSTCRLSAAAAVQGAVIWDSEPCLRCRMLFRCSLVFISPVQSSSQHSNFQLTLSKYHDPLCQGTTEASQPAAYSITPRHKHRSPSTPPHYLA